MKFKLDENFGQSVLEVFKRRGFDCHTVHDEGLVGANDPDERAAAVAEDHVLVTLDRDFTNILIYSLEATAGVAVVQLGKRISRTLLASAMDCLDGVESISNISLATRRMLSFHSILIFSGSWSSSPSSYRLRSNGSVHPPAGFAQALRHDRTTAWASPQRYNTGKKILLLPGWNSVPGGVKPTHLVEPEVKMAYSSDDAIFLVIKHGHDGPWEEREQLRE